MLVDCEFVAIRAHNVEKGVLAYHRARIASHTVTGECTGGVSGGLLWMGSPNQVLRNVLFNSEGRNGGFGEKITG